MTNHLSVVGVKWEHAEVIFVKAAKCCTNRVKVRKRERLRCLEMCVWSSLQLNPTVNTFQRKYVGEIKKCEEMERILGKQ